MKKFLNPEIEIVKFEAEDIITASGGGGMSGDENFGGGDEE